MRLAKTILLLFFIVSCKGKVQTDKLKNGANAQTLLPEGQAKIIRTGNAKTNNIHRSLIDKNGNLWFCTTGDGVYRYDGKTFIHFTEKEGLFNDCVSTVLEDKKGDLWFGTNAGISRYDGHKFTNMPLGVAAGNYFKTYKTTNDPKNPPPKNAVWSLMQDKSGKIWIGTYDDGVYYYDGKAFMHFLHSDSVINKSGIRLGAVNTILEDKAGNMWFTTWFEGLCRYDGKELVSLKPNGEVWYSFLLNDKEGNIWIGRRGKGAIIYDGKNFTNVVQGGTFDSCGISPLFQDKSGKIWFGSIHSNMALRDIKGGLWSYDGKEFKNYRAKDGLDNASIWSAVEDNSGNLWFGATNTSLYRYDGKTFSAFSE